MTTAQRDALMELTDRLMWRARRHQSAFWLGLRVTYLAGLVNSGSRWRALAMCVDVALRQMRAWWVVRYG